MHKIKKDFPFFKNSSIAYLDSAATTQKPHTVIDATTQYYLTSNANANRGSYGLSVASTSLFEEARSKVSDFIGAKVSSSIVFTKGATEALNLAAVSYSSFLKQGDEILISILEHHANLVIWQQIVKRVGAKLVYFNLNEDLEYDLDDFELKLNSNTKVVAFSGASNVLSFEVPIKEMIDLAHKAGAIAIVDCAQLIAHRKIDVTELDADFIAFSGHKVFANQGIGVLYGKKELLDKMPPFLYGGDMIEYVNYEDSTFTETPHKFEAGSQNIEGANSLRVALEYVESIGFEKFREIEKELSEYALLKLKELDFVKLYVPKNFSGSNIIFTVDGVHPHDVAQILDFNGVAIRVGHHCTQVLHRYLGLNSSCRISVSIYNTKDDIDKLIVGLKKVREVFFGN